MMKKRINLNQYLCLWEEGESTSREVGEEVSAWFAGFKERCEEKHCTLDELKHSLQITLARDQDAEHRPHG